MTLDGEMVVCDEDGVSVFAKLHSQSYDGQAFLYAFDLLELNGEDYRGEPLEKRKAKLAKLLARAEPGGFSLPIWPLQGMGEGEEPKQPSNDAD